MNIMNYHLDSSKLKEELVGLRDTDTNQFYDTIYDVISKCQDQVLLDRNPVLDKIRGLDQIRIHFESLEQYEKCGVIRDLINKIRTEWLENYMS